MHVSGSIDFQTVNEAVQPPDGLAYQPSCPQRQAKITVTIQWVKIDTVLLQHAVLIATAQSPGYAIFADISKQIEGALTRCALYRRNRTCNRMSLFCITHDMAIKPDEQSKAATAAIWLGVGAK